MLQNNHQRTKLGVLFCVVSQRKIRNWGDKSLYFSLYSFLSSARNKIAREEMQMPWRVEFVQFKDVLDSSAAFKRRGITVEILFVI